MCNNQPGPSFALPLKILCWNPSRSLRVWGQEPPVSSHGSLYNKPVSAPNSDVSVLFGLTVCQAQELAFSNIWEVTCKERNWLCNMIYKDRGLNQLFNLWSKQPWATPRHWISTLSAKGRKWHSSCKVAIPVNICKRPIMGVGHAANNIKCKDTLTNYHYILWPNECKA